MMITKKMTLQFQNFFFKFYIILQSPGKPQSTKIKSDTVSMFWEKSCARVNQYQIRYKKNKKNSKWKFIETDSDENHITVSGLMANTKYIFQVRGIFGDHEGPFGLVNENIKTKKSLATDLLDFSQLQNNTNSPSIHLLPVEENRSARNKSARTRQLILGGLITFISHFFSSYFKVSITLLNQNIKASFHIL